MKHHLNASFLAVLAVGFLLPIFPVQAGGGFIITESGSPSLWDNSAAVPVHPETATEGTCGSFTNAQMIDKVEEDLETWSGLSDVDLDISVLSGELGSVDGDNYGDYLVGVGGGNDTEAANDDLNPMIFDDDGDIIAAVAGSANRFRVLGFANPEAFSSDFSEIRDGQAVINCRCLTGNANGACTVGGATVTFSEDEVDFTIIHEMGHFLNLDHTQVNDDLNDNDTSDDDDLPTMYPVSVSPTVQLTPHRDDIVALARLYPSSSFGSSTCVLSGELLDADGNELRCADVQAVTTDISDTVAFVSGAEAPNSDDNGDGDSVDDGECLSDCGDFELRLLPGKSYTIMVRPINEAFVGGSGISPCVNEQLDTIEEEEIGTVSSSQCTAGATLEFSAPITTSSTGGVTSSGGSTGTSTSSSSSSSACVLNVQAGGSQEWLGILAVGLLAVVFVLAQRQRGDSA